MKTSWYKLHQSVNVLTTKLMERKKTETPLSWAVAQKAECQKQKNLKANAVMSAEIIIT